MFFLPVYAILAAPGRCWPGGITPAINHNHLTYEKHPPINLSHVIPVFIFL